jgi:hypothetical protein
MAHGASFIHHQREQWCVCDGDHACVGARLRTARWRRRRRKAGTRVCGSGAWVQASTVGPSAAAATRARAHDDDGHDPGASGARYCRPARAHRGRALPPLLSRKRQGVGDVRRERILSRSIIKYGPGFAFLLLLNIPVVSCPYSCPVGHPAENTRRGNPTPHAPIDSRVPFHGGRNRSATLFSSSNSD